MKAVAFRQCSSVQLPTRKDLEAKIDEKRRLSIVNLKKKNHISLSSSSEYVLICRTLPMASWAAATAPAESGPRRSDPGRSTAAAPPPLPPRTRLAPGRIQVRVTVHNCVALHATEVILQNVLLSPSAGFRAIPILSCFGIQFFFLPFFTLFWK